MNEKLFGDRVFIYDGNEEERLCDTHHKFLDIISSFQKMIDENRFNYESITFTNNDLTNIGLHTLTGKIMIKIITLKNLIFSANQIDLVGLQLLSKSITTLTHLDVSFNKIDLIKEMNVPYSIFETLLGNNSNLTYLNLSENKLTDILGEQIFKYIARNNVLERLILRNTLLTSALTKIISNGRFKNSYFSEKLFYIYRKKTLQIIILPHQPKIKKNKDDFFILSYHPSNLITKKNIKNFGMACLYLIKRNLSFLDFFILLKKKIYCIQILTIFFFFLKK